MPFQIGPPEPPWKITDWCKITKEFAKKALDDESVQTQVEEDEYGIAAVVMEKDRQYWLVIRLEQPYQDEANFRGITMSSNGDWKVFEGTGPTSGEPWEDVIVEISQGGVIGGGNIRHKHEIKNVLHGFFCE